MQNPPPMYPAGGGMSSQDLQPQDDNDKIMAALSYILIVIMSVIILATDMKNKPFLKYHAYQSLTLGIALFVLYVILSITVVGLCVAPLLFLVQLWYGYQAYTKGIFTIPVVTDLTAKLFKDFPGQTSGAI
jgi:uncharacterized membrane protein